MITWSVIVSIVLDVFYCTLLSERNTLKVTLSCLFYFVVSQYVLIKVRDLNILSIFIQTYRVLFHHLKWVQNDFVVVVCVKTAVFCYWWKRVLYLLVVATATEIFGRTDVLFPASRGLSRRDKLKREERDLSRLPTSFLSRMPSRFLNNQWRFCHVRHNPEPVWIWALTRAAVELERALKF